ncbi:MAG TPA: EamA family transporter [Acidimicrobiales bacterium]|nr:EamA family transporter [Acidimicrobiales bacterium]
MPWIALGILAQALATGAVLVDKAVISRFNPRLLTLVTLVGVSNLGLAVVLVCTRSWPDVGVTSALTGVLSGVLLVGYLVPYFQALRGADASAVGTLFQLAPLWTLLIAALFLGERPSGVQYIGFSIVLVGALSVELAATSMRPHLATMVLMVVCTLIAAASFALAKRAYEHTNFWDATLFVSLGAAVGAALVLVASPSRSEVIRQVVSLPARVFGAMALAETLNLGFEILFLAAISRGPVALVSVTQGAQPVMLIVGAATLTRILPQLFAEKRDAHSMRRKLGGAAAVLVGFGLLR